MNLKGRDFLKLLDYTPEEIGYLIDRAAELKAQKKAGIAHRLHEGKNVALIFEKTSTRTRCAFEVAAHDLGMGVTYLDPTGSQIPPGLRSAKRSPLPTPPVSSVGCTTALNTVASARKLWKSLPNTLPSPFGTG